MARPETSEEVVELIRRGRLLATPQYDGLLAELAVAGSPDRTLRQLVERGLLTCYQAEELAAGRWRGLWLGGYRILDRLGKGGMSHVYLAEHAVLGKRVAVKVLSAGLRSDTSARQRFVREARAAAAVDHPNIVHVFDIDMDHDPPFLVMEYVDGVNLQAAVARHGPFTAKEAASVGVEVARGLAAAAAAGLVHRDVKPANLLVDRQGRIKILDLGIVRLPGEDSISHLDSGEDSEVILGTIDYLAPEQAVDSSTVDSRADVYALGATLYFLLAGHPPFPGSDVRHKLAAKRYGDPVPIHRLRPDIDTKFSDIIHSMLVRVPADRCPSAQAAVTALAPFSGRVEDFPDRLFRPGRPSSADPSKEHAVLSITERIRKPAAKSEPPPEPNENAAPTDVLMRAPTDLAMAPLPVALFDRPQRPRTSPLVRWVVVGILIFLLGLTVLLLRP